MPFDGFAERMGFVRSTDQDHHLTGVCHGADTYGEGACGYLREVIVKEAAVVTDRLGHQTHLTGARG